MNRKQSDFARVYEEQVWQVYGFFAYRVGDKDAAEDLTQTTFERALRAWSRFDPRRGSERTWLFAIARNLLIDHHRRKGSAALTALVETDLEPVDGPEERFASPVDIQEALSQLSEREREVLALRYGGDLSGPEIARLLGLSLANVQQINSRALHKLRRLVEGPPQSFPVASSASARIEDGPGDS